MYISISSSQSVTSMTEIPSLPIICHVDGIVFMVIDVDKLTWKKIRWLATAPSAGLGSNFTSQVQDVPLNGIG